MIENPQTKQSLQERESCKHKISEDKGISKQLKGNLQIKQDVFVKH